MSKKMSVNKVLTLIGAILFSFAPIVFLVMSIVFGAMKDNPAFVSGFNANYTGSSSVSASAIASILVVFFIAAFILTLGICVVNWFAFAKLDGPKGKAWRIYLLIIGIVICIFGIWFYLIGAASGVLFILAFALKRHQPEVSLMETVADNAEGNLEI